jgi:hypothetical protein
MKPILVKYKCQLCSRHSFDRPSPHKCVGGFRKRKIVWGVYYVSENVVLLEKVSENNVYKNIMKKVLQTHSITSRPYGRKSLQKQLDINL